MDEQKLTDWFPPEVLPARAGLYIRDWGGGLLEESADYFDGQHWFAGGYDAETWTRVISSRPSRNNRRWRGLAEPPLTDWFEDGVKPARPGVYEIDCSGDTNGRAFSHWDGIEWGYRRLEEYCGGVQGAIDAASAARRIRVPFKRRWCGLAVQP